ncbi:50S ribosomal protein L17 [Fontivita pretiosa]|jgi:large subunit ribosomal protein L17|uniref:50S ribosomal protein L17 n=1 Tax=Fontivita pretiosa TaxID=2989684 RepID=UPI003D1685FD
MSRHLVRGRQLSRDTEHRKALRRNLVQSLFENGKVRTTLPKAKEVKAFAEKLITLAKVGDLNARRRVIAALQDRRLVDANQDFTGQTVVQKLFSEIAPKFRDRNGGYTRIIKTANYRIGDGGGLVILQLLTEESAPQGTARRSAGLRRKRYERRHQFASRVLKARTDKSTQTQQSPEPQQQPEQPQEPGQASPQA